MSENTTIKDTAEISSYAAVQNNIILDVYPSIEEARHRISEEKSRDFISIMLKRKLRRMIKHNSNIALHRYSVMKINNVEDLI